MVNIKTFWTNINYFLFFLLTLYGIFDIFSYSANMVGVVQLVERQIVDLVVVGSSPISHPSDYRINS